MTIRTLPVAKIGTRPNNVQSDISPLAMERWNPDVRNAGGTDNNIISIMDYIGADMFGNGVTSNRVTGALRAIGNQPVTVEINSPGGDFFEGLAIYNALREHTNSVTVKVLGMAASAAAIIAMAGDQILVARAGFLMIHNVMVLAYGNANEMRDIADSLDPFDAVLTDIFASRSGLAPKDVTKMLDAETWIGGSEAVDMGMADGLLPSDEISTTKNKPANGPAAAMRRIDAALAKGERISRSERRNLIKELASMPSATSEDDTPSAVENAVDDGSTGLRLALAHLTLVGA